jgi:hypothetical protein
MRAGTSASLSYGGHAAVLVAHEDGAVVADPRVVQRHDEDIHIGAEQLAGLGLLGRVHDHRDGLEAADAAGDLGPLGARVVHERTEEVLAAGPGHQGALVLAEPGGEAKAVRARGGACHGDLPVRTSF